MPTGYRAQNALTLSIDEPSEVGAAPDQLANEHNVEKDAIDVFCLIAVGKDVWAHTEVHMQGYFHNQSDSLLGRPRGVHMQLWTAYVQKRTLWARCGLIAWEGRILGRSFSTMAQKRIHEQYHCTQNCDKAADIADRLVDAEKEIRIRILRILRYSWNSVRFRMARHVRSSEQPENDEQLSSLKERVKWGEFSTLNSLPSVQALMLMRSVWSHWKLRHLQ